MAVSARTLATYRLTMLCIDSNACEYLEYRTDSSLILSNIILQDIIFLVKNCVCGC